MTLAFHIRFPQKLKIAAKTVEDKGLTVRGTCVAGRPVFPWSPCHWLLSGSDSGCHSWLHRAGLLWEPGPSSPVSALATVWGPSTGPQTETTLGSPVSKHQATQTVMEM